MLVVSIAAAAFFGVTPPALAEDCGKVTVAEMSWGSAGAIAQIDKIILESGYGCDVELVDGETIPTFSSMTTNGEPDVAPELWISGIREPLEKSVADGALIIAGEILSEGGVEGFWVPTYIAEEYGIYTVRDALAHPGLFPGAKGKNKGAFHTCPVSWSCHFTTANLFRAFGFDEAGFELVDLKSTAGLNGSLATANERRQGWLGYYWAPTAILGKYDMTLLDFEVEHDQAEWETCTVKKSCEDPKPNAWKKFDVYTVVTGEFAARGGPVMDYFNGRRWDNRTVGKVLAWISDNQANNEDGAYFFLENFQDVWTEWVGPEVAEKVKAAL